MNLVLWRTEFFSDCTKGLLFHDGLFECFTLEPPRTLCGVQNVPDKTCVLPGLYVTSWKQSVKFDRIVPVLLTPPGRKNIEIHPLNRPDETEGCIGVGAAWSREREILLSDIAFTTLMMLLNPAWKIGVAPTLEIRELPGVTLA